MQYVMFMIVANLLLFVCLQMMVMCQQHIDSCPYYWKGNGTFYWKDNGWLYFLQHICKCSLESNNGNCVKSVYVLMAGSGMHLIECLYGLLLLYTVSKS